MVITTRSGKILPSPSMGKSIDGEVVVDEFEEINPVKFEKLDSSVNTSKKERKKEEEVVLKSIPKPLPPFSQRLRKKVDDAKFNKSLAMLKQLTINLPLIEELEQMPEYAKFMKDIVTKKRA